jgi:MraZ protein
MDPHIVRFRRLYISAACDCEADKAGRVLVPASLRERCHLSDQALWAGMGSHLELWAQSEWDKTLELSPADEISFKQAILEQMKI